MLKTTYRFILTEDDFLIYTLYNASLSALVRRRRQRMRWVVALLYCGLGTGLFLSGAGKTGGLVFMIFGILWFLLYPRYSAWRYKKVYRRMVGAQVKDRLHKPYEMEPGPEALLIRNATSESRITYEGVKTLVILPEHFLVQLREKPGLVVPRHAVPDTEAFTVFFVQKGIPLTPAEQWTWK